MSKKRILSTLGSIGFISILTMNCFAFTPPPPSKCNMCHGLDGVYQEYTSASNKHAKSQSFDPDQGGLGCFNCHIPGGLQMKQLGLNRGEIGFHITGYI